MQEKTIWQQTGAEGRRDYVKLCLEWGVILFRHGEYGSWPDCENKIRDAEKLKNPKNQKITDKTIEELRYFCEEMKCGDLVVLYKNKDGKTKGKISGKIFGVGEIVDEYKYCHAFRDVDGRNMAHVRRVRWLWRKEDDNSTQKPLPEGVPEEIMICGRTHRLKNPPDIVNSLMESLEREARPGQALIELPPNVGDDASVNEEDIGIEEISEYLSDKGVISNFTSSLLSQICEIREFVKSVKWYTEWWPGKNPSEPEMTAHFVVPLLRALGWTREMMAIEWNIGERRRIDVALFSQTPRQG